MLAGPEPMTHAWAETTVRSAMSLLFLIMASQDYLICCSSRALSPGGRAGESIELIYLRDRRMQVINDVGHYRYGR
jgi:hypothetical protein